MKIKFFVTNLVAMLLMANVFSQDTISLLINGRKIGQATIAADQPVTINVKKVKYKNISSAILTVNPKSPKDAFKRTIQIADGNENILYTVNESSSKHGWYKIDLARIRSKLLKQRVLKIFLTEDPANSMMKIRSSRKLLAEIHFT
jgi:hypothetical protein